MTSNQSKQFVLNYKNGDQNTRVAMLQGLDLQFGNLNNKAFQQLLNDGLPETAILSSYFQNPQITEAFLSFDSKEKRKELKDFGKQNGVKFDKLTKDIRTSKAIRLFEDIVATNTGANSADTLLGGDRFEDHLGVAGARRGGVVGGRSGRGTRARGPVGGDRSFEAVGAAAGCD